MANKENKNQNFRQNVNQYLFSPHLEDDEKILYIARRHPLMLVKNGLMIVFFHFFLPIFFWNVFPEIWFVFLVWLIYGFISINKLIFNWYFDAVLVTSMGLVDVKWNGPFDRSSNRMEYTMIEGTSYQFKGVLQTLFNFGTIQVNRSTGAIGIEQEDVIDPVKVESIILDYQEKYITQKNFKDSTALKNLLSEMVKDYASKIDEIEIKF